MVAKSFYVGILLSATVVALPVLPEARELELGTHLTKVLDLKAERMQRTHSGDLHAEVAPAYHNAFLSWNRFGHLIIPGPEAEPMREDAFKNAEYGHAAAENAEVLGNHARSHAAGAGDYNLRKFRARGTVLQLKAAEHWTRHRGKLPAKDPHHLEPEAATRQANEFRMKANVLNAKMAVVPPEYMW